MLHDDDTEARSTLDRRQSRQIDAQLSWLISLLGLAIIAAQTVPAFLTWQDFPWLWNVVAGLVVVITLVGCFSRRLPYPVLRAGWIAALVVVTLSLATTFWAYRGDDVDDFLPWPWTTQIIVAGYLALWLPTGRAVAVAAATAALPAASGLVTLGHVPALVLTSTPIYVANFAFTALFVVTRGRLRETAVARRRAWTLRAHTEAAEVDLQQRRWVSAVVHDEVLSVLSAAKTHRGIPTPELRAEAERALATFTGAPRPTEGLVTSAALAERLRTAVADLDPASRLSVEVERGRVPAAVAESLVSATSEALRNSVRHAGPGARREVAASVSPSRVTVTVTDDGVGFDPDAIAPNRLGVRRSIVGRVESLRGGTAIVAARPGAGTEVILSWHR